MSCGSNGSRAPDIVSLALAYDLRARQRFLCPHGFHGQTSLEIMNCTTEPQVALALFGVDAATYGSNVDAQTVETASTTNAGTTLPCRTVRGADGKVTQVCD